MSMILYKGRQQLEAENRSSTTGQVTGRGPPLVRSMLQRMSKPFELTMNVGVEAVLATELVIDLRT